MTTEQWNILQDIIKGGVPKTIPVGFIIDSPWLPGWYGISTIDYYTSDSLWFEANKKVVETFKDVIFFPGFWSEFGMCTEPSAFGAKSIWAKNNLPHADKIINNIEEIDNVKKPNVETDGLLPFMIRRLVQNQNNINDAGHEIKFAISRGPLNIASFLMGATEFIMGIAMKNEKIHKLLNIVNDFIIDWLSYQKEIFPSIEGILILDDIVGFIGESDFKEYALPYLKNIFNSFNAQVNLFHNDSKGLVCSSYLKDIGIDIFNFSYEHSINEIKELTDNKIILLGNIPPVDILAQSSEEDIHKCVKNTFQDITDCSGIIWSCGGGMPPDVSTENINAFVKAVRKK